MSGGTTDTVSAKGDDVSCEARQRRPGPFLRDVPADRLHLRRRARCRERRRRAQEPLVRVPVDAAGLHQDQGEAGVERFPDRGRPRVPMLVYPKGDSMALPGYISAYLQVDASKESATSARNGTSPTTGADADWECFVSYELAVVRPTGASSPHAGSASTGAAAEAGARRDSWHRFSSRKKSHGWCDFARSAVVLDSKNGYLVDDTLTVEARIIFLNESSELVAEPASSGKTSRRDGKFTWTVENLRHFAVMLKTQKVSLCRSWRGLRVQTLRVPERRQEKRPQRERTPRTARPRTARRGRLDRVPVAVPGEQGDRHDQRRQSRRALGAPRRSARRRRRWSSPRLERAGTPRSARLRASRPAGRAGLCSGLPPRTRRTERRACIGTRTDASPATRSEGTRRALGGTISCPWRRSRGGTT